LRGDEEHGVDIQGKLDELSLETFSLAAIGREDPTEYRRTVT
jgi:hypothetical protein